jgi:hypothetical protein
MFKNNAKAFIEVVRLHYSFGLVHCNLNLPAVLQLPGGTDTAIQRKDKYCLLVTVVLCGSKHYVLLRFEFCQLPTSLV